MWIFFFSATFTFSLQKRLICGGSQKFHVEVLKNLQNLHFHYKKRVLSI